MTEHQSILIDIEALECYKVTNNDTISESIIGRLVCLADRYSRPSKLASALALDVTRKLSGACVGRAIRSGTLVGVIVVLPDVTLQNLFGRGLVLAIGMLTRVWTQLLVHDLNVLSQVVLPCEDLDAPLVGTRMRTQVHVHRPHVPLQVLRPFERLDAPLVGTGMRTQLLVHDLSVLSQLVLVVGCEIAAFIFASIGPHLAVHGPSVPSQLVLVGGCKMAAFIFASIGPQLVVHGPSVLSQVALIGGCKMAAFIFASIGPQLVVHGPSVLSQVALVGGCKMAAFIFASIGPQLVVHALDVPYYMHRSGMSVLTSVLWTQVVADPSDHVRIAQYESRAQFCMITRICAPKRPLLEGQTVSVWCVGSKMVVCDCERLHSKALAGDPKLAAVLQGLHSIDRSHLFEKVPGFPGFLPSNLHNTSLSPHYAVCAAPAQVAI